MEVFQQLGRDIEDRWRRLDYNEDVFPALASDSLNRADIPSKISAWDIIEWTLEQNELPPQKDLYANFGDPPITLFVAPRFYIDAYFWLEGTTSIHQHGFCGAFQVLMGSSIHSWYEFERRDAINIFTEIGYMRLKVCNLLEVGDVQEIAAGRQYIHSLFHLDRPSVTVVIRTEKSPLYMPQYSYHKPNLAIDPFYEHQTTTKKLQSLSVLFRDEHAETDRIVKDLLADSDFQTSIDILSAAHSFLGTSHLGRLFNLSGPAERFRSYLETVRERHGEKADVLPAVFAHRDMVNEIVQRRSYVTDADQRFFLALLLNVDGRENIFALIRQRFPDADPMEKVLDWTFDLAHTRVVGVNTPNALGIEGFGDLDLLILEGMLRGKTDEQIANELKSEHGAGENGHIFGDFEMKLTRIREALIFRPLFSGERGAVASAQPMF